MYEVITILKPTLSTESTESIINNWKETITSMGGELERLTRIGKRTLAYEVKKNRQGYMVLMHIKGVHAIKDELERQFKISENVIKFQTIKLNDLHLKVSDVAISRWEARNAPTPTEQPDVSGLSKPEVAVPATEVSLNKPEKAPVETESKEKVEDEKPEETLNSEA